MTNEQKKSLLEQAAFLSIDDNWYRMDLCTDEGIYYSDEEYGEQYCDTYEEIDMSNIELCELPRHK